MSISWYTVATQDKNLLLKCDGFEMVIAKMKKFDNYRGEDTVLFHG